MRSPYRKPSVVAAVILSVALHGIFVIGLWRLPVSGEVAPADADPTLAPGESESVLRLADAPRPKLPATTPRPHRDDIIQQAAFEVHLVDPPTAPAPLPSSVNAAVGLPTQGNGAHTSTGSAGEGTGKARPPCALEVGGGARSVVYVVDHSVSMGFHGALARARLEIVASLKRLGRFHIRFEFVDQHPRRDDRFESTAISDFFRLTTILCGRRPTPYRHCRPAAAPIMALLCAALSPFILTSSTSSATPTM